LGCGAGTSCSRAGTGVTILLDELRHEIRNGAETTAHTPARKKLRRVNEFEDVGAGVPAADETEKSPLSFTPQIGNASSTMQAFRGKLAY
jgi:hypothetical protein